ncbi:MAG: FtsX-like permease family protein, partial [Bacteroidota bacterium]
MNLFKLSWKNIFNKPLNALLSLVLFALGVGLISLLFIFNKQFKEKFEKNLADISLVIGAKGSPLQMILCSMYHVDAPTGNIKIDDAKAFMNPNHPLIKKAVPLSLGDNYQGNRIVGTTHDFLELYDTKLEDGRMFKHRFEVVVGKQVEKKHHLHIGSTFHSSHGFIIDENLVHDDNMPFKVVGVLELNGSVADQLIITNTESIWGVHEGHDHDEEGHNHDEEGHDGHDHGDEGHDHDSHDHAGHDHADHDHDNFDYSGYENSEEVDAKNAAVLLKYPEKDITSLLLQFKNNNYQSMNMLRGINENTELMAASPPLEINKLYANMDVGTNALRWLAIIIAAVSGLSIFISLFSSLKDRKYELALMRVMGSSRGKIFWLIILEGLIIAIIGFVVGILLSHVGMKVLGYFLEDQFQYHFNAFSFQKE